MITTGGAGQLTPYRELTATTAGVFFLHDGGTNTGLELWLTDGTLAGTNLVKDIAVGAVAGPVEGTLTAALGGTQLLFAATDLDSGLQLWLSDGTTANTRKATSFGGAGYGAVKIENFFSTGTRTFFSANEGINGLEPWVYDTATAGLAFVLPYGTACTGTPGLPEIGANGLPTIDNAAFEVAVSNALPLSLAVPAGAVGPNNINLGGGCRLWLDFPYVLLPAAFVDATGNAVSPLPIPNNPNLVGYNLFFQWAVLDPAGPFLGDFALSGGLQVQLGN